ncbi:RNA-directed DNA polymerase, eukaryota, reverse transcriptase zinc-binding domain protein [Tanacetum coccineum]
MIHVTKNCMDWYTNSPGDDVMITTKELASPRVLAILGKLVPVGRAIVPTGKNIVPASKEYKIKSFHVSNLKKCLADAGLHVPLDEIKVDKTLCFVEEPVEIMDREVKRLKRSELHENTKVREILFLYCYAFSVSLFLTPLCYDDIHDVTPHVSALAGCDKMSRIQAWNMVIDKVVSRLSKWKAKTLSIGGRFTITKSVLSSLPTYYFSLFKVPVGVLRRLKSYRSSFFRGVDSGVRKTVWFDWDKVVASKDVGGLVSVIKAIHGPCGNLERVVLVGKSSIWLDCIRSMTRLKDRGVDLLSYDQKKVRNEGRLGGVESIQMEELTNKISMVAFSEDHDRWLWSLDGEGLFSVGSVRKCIDNAYCLLDGLPTRWINLVPIKVNILAWRIGWNKLPSRFNMSLRGLEVPSIVCPVCQVGVETINHLFFSCLIASVIVSKIQVWWGLLVFRLYSYQDWLNWLGELKIRREMKDYLEGTMLVSWWIIWNYRNKLIFSSDVPAKAPLFDLIVHYAFLWCNARGRRKINMVDWLKCPLTALL